MTEKLVTLELNRVEQEAVLAALTSQLERWYAADPVISRNKELSSIAQLMYQNYIAPSDAVIRRLVRLMAKAV